MEAVIRAAESRFDVVVIDAPPGDGCRDLAGYAGGVLVVVRMRKTFARAAERLRAALDGAHARVIGVVANGARAAPAADARDQSEHVD
jgi:non-specific protein-tyrosine kinase